MRIRFWGVRGTIPTPGWDTVRLGGNTPCLDVLTSDNQLIIIDAGSGIRRLGLALADECAESIQATILISHTHWDHIQGFPFFSPLVADQDQNPNHFMVVGQKRMGRQLESIMAGQIIEPYLPFAYRELTANIKFKEVVGGQEIEISDQTLIHVNELKHPGGCLGFRIENNGHVFTYCTDSSHVDGQLTESVVQLAKGADLLVHDAQYTLAQRAMYGERGHSSWLEAARVARSAGVGCLALFHYDPDATDDHMQRVLEKTRQEFSQTILSREGLVLHLPLGDRV